MPHAPVWIAGTAGIAWRRSRKTCGEPTGRGRRSAIGAGKLARGMPLFDDRGEVVLHELKPQSQVMNELIILRSFSGNGPGANNIGASFSCVFTTARS